MEQVSEMVSTKIGVGVGAGNVEHESKTREEEEGHGRRRWLACRGYHPALNSLGDIHLHPAGATGMGRARGGLENKGH
jgi:hypothetical protein